MQHQEERDPRVLIAGISENPSSIQSLTEGECLTFLQMLEQQRLEHPDEELDLAEAMVLTRMSALRMHKTGGHTLAAEWVDRALQLAPDYRYAREVKLELYFSQLRSHVFLTEFKSVRETDNVVMRRRTVEVLAEQATNELAEITKWRALAEETLLAAQKWNDSEAEATAAGLVLLYTERQNLLVQLQERVQAYGASLSGVFYSSEMLVQLQETIRALTNQQDQKENLLPQRNERIEDREKAPQQDLSALEQLEQLIGLDEIKQRVRQLAQFLQYRQLREEKGWHMKDQLPLHLVLMGNPGTGKTTLARLIAKLYQELGLLAKGQLIEVDRSQLVGAYVGQTEQRVMDAIKQADGGVLFIDEAYSLKRPDSSGSDYGQVAIDTLVSAMTSGEYAGRFVVMLAGYPEEMRHFLYANPGLNSRFPETGHFLLPDYQADELVKIAEEVAGRNDFTLTEAAKITLRQRIEKAQVDETFGNARAVTNIVLDAIFAKGRETDGKELKWDDFTILKPEDVRGFDPPQTERNAEARLQALIGLAQVKTELKKIAAYVSVQQEREARGLPKSPIELHAVFTGNPGTGKTTVAQLYAQILQEIGYLKRGHLVTASRADLVAGYVGQTAALTRRKVREALGGVLFIDEAYSLLGGGERDFGQEAVDTLVEEMTKHEENLVVVLAGYPLEMNTLMMSNPGLLSRFKKYIAFPDYTVKELVHILEQAACEVGYAIEKTVLEKISQSLEKAVSDHRLNGNGRFSHNLLQEAIQNQAVRLMDIPKQEWNQEMLMQLAWADFQPLLQWTVEENGAKN
ncbi:AAA family ATPase [Brevibacillus brevis]|uniref:AAA family ATPase n=1 Tax=Brevibacillus brevis TaxID=1393 RepID=UPI0007D8C391|nr:AAA family ATPase [Brevibacillus brevis]